MADYWPEFAAGVKQGVTVRQILAHRAGLIAPEQDLHHAVTFGFLAGEILRRATGRRPAQRLRDEAAGPLGSSLLLILPQPHRMAS